MKRVVSRDNTSLEDGSSAAVLSGTTFWRSSSVGGGCSDCPHRGRAVSSTTLSDARRPLSQDVS